MRFFQRNARMISVLAALAAMIFLNAWAFSRPAAFLWIENSFAELTKPVLGVFSGMTSYVVEATDYIYELKDTQTENSRLRKQVSSLKSALSQIEEIRAENDRLLALNALNNIRSFDTVAVARVIATSAYGGNEQFIRLSKGSSSGIAKDMAVLTLDGLVGRIVEVSAHTSKVKLITDPQSSVGCVVQRSRSAGIAKGQGHGSIELAELTRESDVKKGDLVVTSGLGVTFPSGIPVARIISVDKKELGMFHVAKIQPVIDFNRLEEVSVARASEYLPEGGQ